MEIDRNNLPHDPAVLQAMVADLLTELDAKERRLLRVLHQLEKLLRWRYGPKRERIDEHQMFLFAVGLVGTDQDIPVAPVEPRPKKRRSKGHGRRRLPKHLERRQVVYDVPADERQCPHCREALRLMGEDVSERLEYVPASLYVIEEVCRKYGCPKGCTVRTGQKPMQPIEKGLPGPGLLAHVVVSKYADHQPLHRQEQLFKRQGVTLSRKTLCDWMRRCAQLLTPLFEEMKRQALRSKVVQTDDTPVGVLDPGLTRTRTGRIWTYVGDEIHPYTVYDYTPNRSRDGPDAFLEDFSGFLQADAYSGYDHLYNDPARDVTEVACWAHTRRKFYEAQSSDLMRSTVLLAYIRLLYDIEREARDRHLDSQGRFELRQSQSVPILRDIEAYLKREHAHVLPKSPEGQAIAYALSNWQALVRYCEDGDLEIDNNGAERSLRGVAIGRKNWLYFGSDNGGRTAAILTSFITTCKRLGINPHAYLRDIFARISAHKQTRLDELLPDKWRAAQSAPTA
jgi:transposase